MTLPEYYQYLLQLPQQLLQQMKTESLQQNATSVVAKKKKLVKKIFSQKPKS